MQITTNRNINVPSIFLMAQARLPPSLPARSCPLINYFSFPQRALFDKVGIRTMVMDTDPYGNFLTQGYEISLAAATGRASASSHAGHHLYLRRHDCFSTSPHPAVADRSFAASKALSRLL
jgi:hypothetical protein